MSESLLPDTVIVAAGFGTRLGKFGEETPKGLIVTPSGETIIGETIRRIAPLTRRICLITNGRFEKKYKKWLKNSEYANRVEFMSNNIFDPALRNGALKDLSLALDNFHLDKSNVFVCPSDTHFDFPLSDFSEFCLRRPDIFATILQKKESVDEIKNRLGCAIVENDRIVSFIEKPEDPPSLYAVIPFYYYPNTHQKLLNKFIKDGGNPDAPSNIISWFIENKIEVRSYLMHGNALDVGTPLDMDKLQKSK